MQMKFFRVLLRMMGTAILIVSYDETVNHHASFVFALTTIIASYAMIVMAEFIPNDD